MPKVFLSHSSLDQARFVRGLAERLQSNGVETWYSEWALLDGDSLTDRIFEQGIANADVFIVVLSENTASSNWVRAELEVGLVRRIGKQCRLIPVVLDGVPVPVALEGTLQRRISDVNSYDDEFEALLRSVLSQTSTPTLGRPPTYAATPAIPGLTNADTVVLHRLAEVAIATESLLVDGSELHASVGGDGLSDQAVIEAIHAIDARGLIKEARQFGSRIQYVHVRHSLIRAHLAAALDLKTLERRLLAEIVNTAADHRLEVGELAAAVGVQKPVAHAVLDRLDRRMLWLSPRLGGQVYVDQVSPLLARELT